MNIGKILKIKMAGGISNISYGTTGSEKFDLYIPKSNKKNKLILFIHGGGFVSGDKTDCIDYCISYTQKGYYCAAVNYTLLNGIANPSLNVNELMYAVARIQKYVWDRYKVYLDGMATYGISAGANLALLLPYKVQTTIPCKLAIAKVPPTTFDPELWEDSIYFNSVIEILEKKGIKITDKKKVFEQYVCGGDWKSCSPVCYNPIATMCLFGLKDVVVPQFNREKINELMKTIDIPYYYKDMPNSGHACEDIDQPIQKLFDLQVDKWLLKFL